MEKEEAKQDELSPLDAAIIKYTPYLKELQKKILTVICIALATGVIAGIQYEQILSWVIHLFNLDGINIVLTSPYQFFSLAINTGLSIGITVAFPFLLYFLITFLRPALNKTEYHTLLKLIPASILLFCLGFGTGVWILQFVIDIYIKTSSTLAVQNYWDIGHFLSQIIIMGSLMGLMFQLPIVITALIRLHIIKLQVFSKYRRFFYAGIIIFVILLPPTDVFSNIMLMAPPLFLFEIALLLNRKV